MTRGRFEPLSASRSLNPMAYRLFRIAIPIWLLMIFLWFRSGSSPSPLAEAASPSLEIAIPKTIHQLLISMPKRPVRTFEPSSHTVSWMQSGWKMEYWSEDACAELAKEINSTGIYARTWENLPSAVLKSDFCRYLIMYGKGGVYNDLDVHLMKALPWNVMGPATDGKGPPALIVGLEGDATSGALPRSPQFVQWTIASAPSHPVLRNVIERIADVTPGYALKAAEDPGNMDIMNWTGPSIWTDAVLAYLECTKEEIEKLKDLKEALRIKDVLLLPKRAFAVIQGEDHQNPDILVKHYFSGTWKTCQKSWISWILPFGC
jgi:alpha 1,6-mannosyltransferase